MCLDRNKSGERRMPVKRDPGIRAIWYNNKGVGRRKVRI
jgi:hypothetical protein